MTYPPGFLDGKPERGEVPEVSTKVIGEVVRLVAQACQDAGVKLTPAKFADLVTIVYQDAITHKEVRGKFLQSIIDLTK